VLKIAGIILSGALVLFLAGCTTTPGPNESLPPDWSANGPVSKPVLPAHVQPIPGIGQTNQSTTIAPSNLPPVGVAKPAPVLTWTSLNRWVVENHIGPLRRITGGPVTGYSISSKDGVLVLGIGSREATWRGMEIHLGFAPEIIDGQVFVHGLDLQKNLEPLILDPPPGFGTNRVLVIDPGHGGVNSGTVSVLDKRPEKEFTLDWARRIQTLLATNGWTVFLTRTNDAEIGLSNRVYFAEAHHADLFISLHFNSAAPDKRQSGVETYCLTPTGMPSTLTRGFSDVWSEHFPNNNFDAANIQWSTRLHAALLCVNGEEDRGVRRARFMGVLQGQRRPAVLLEGGFLSNPAEAKRIESPEFRQKLAEAIAQALK
jgi:N-acetylmuramoyl-L-alanine amidase